MSKRKVAYALLAVVAVVLVWLLIKPENKAPTYEPAKVTRGDVYHVVSVTGHVEPVTRINLAFPVGGRVSALPAEEGMEVLEGTVLAVLDGGIQQSALLEAQSRAQREQALLSDLTAPLRDEERAVKTVAVENAQLSLTRAEESARGAIARAFVYADDAVHEEADELFENTQGSSPRFGISFAYGSTNYLLQTDNATEYSINSKRSNIEAILAEMKARTDDSITSTEILLEKTDDDLAYIEDFLTDIAQVINDYTSDSVTNQTVYETFQTSVASARTAINTARSEISVAFTAYTTAFSTLTSAESNLTLSEAGASNQAIAAQKASVASALAAVGTAAERAQDTVLTAPFDGALSKIEFDIGEIVSPYEPVAELIAEGAYEVEAFIPEADIANLKLGDKAEITFDAYERTDVFTAEVIRIALSETVKDGVPTYKTTLRLTNGHHKDITIRPGMTADVEILTERKEEVLFVPTRSVLSEGDRRYVQIFDGENFKEVDIETGLRGSEGTIEVVNGLEEGDEIVLYVEE